MLATLLGAMGPGALIAGALVYIALQIKRFALAFEERDKQKLSIGEKGLSVGYDIRHELRLQNGREAELPN